MGQQSLATVLGQLRRLIGGQPIDDASDGQLLERFVARQDQSAFAALMQRHGPMVLGTCRRVLAGSHDAEDAYQATFVVLARRAGSLYREGSLAGWLHAVASRIALKARAKSTRRHEREKPGEGTPEAAMPSRIDPFLQAADREAKWLLDEELNQLPDKYRGPMVLCYLEGKTNEEAARELGCPAGSMSWKLDKGRELLKQRLAKKGVSISAVGLTALFADQASAAVPTALFEATHQAVGVIMTGQTGAGLLSVKAMAWADAALQAMFWAKLKMAAAAVLMICLLGAGAGALAYQGDPIEPPATLPATPDLGMIEQVRQQVADWQPTDDERRFDQIGWSRSVVEGQLLASQSGRPMFLVTHAGDMGLGRSCGGSHAMRGGALSNPEIIELLNRHFVPVYVSNQQSGQALGTGSELAERIRIYQSALKANLHAGSNSVYIVAPDGRVLDAGHGCHLVAVDDLLDFLCQNLADAQPGDGPLIQPKEQSAPPAAPSGSLVLHLTTRYLRPDRTQYRVPLGQRRGYDWKAYPAEDWLVWSPAEVARLLAPRLLSIGDVWDIDGDLARQVFVRCYPPCEENDLARNQIEKQELTATVLSLQGEVAIARLDGRLKMAHPFYPGKDDPRHVAATVTGFIEFEPATKRIRSLQLTTPSATYGNVQFGVAIRSQ